MESDLEGKPEGKGVAPPMSDYSIRAASALNQLLPGAHRDKTVARLFGCSVRMAKYLRTGRHWTTDRLSQASAVLGVAFDAALYSPSSTQEHLSEMTELHDRLARLEGIVDQMARGGDAGLASETGGQALETGRQETEEIG